MTHHRRRLATFTGRGYDKGRSTLQCAAWALVAEPLQRSVPVSYTHLDVYKRQLLCHGTVLHEVREARVVLLLEQLGDATVGEVGVDQGHPAAEAHEAARQFERHGARAVTGAGARDHEDGAAVGLRKHRGVALLLSLIHI